MSELEDWSGKSVSFFTKLLDPPFPLPSFLSPARLFNLAFNADGSFYTAYFGGGTQICEKSSKDGVLQVEDPIPIGNKRECRFSIHGSGEVRSFVRGEGEKIHHLGYELRSLGQPRLLFQHFIGGAGEYIVDPLAVIRSKRNAVIVPGIFEKKRQAFFSTHVAPEGYVPALGNIVWQGLTKKMDNGLRLAVAVTLGCRDLQPGQSREHEFRVHLAKNM